MTLKRYNTIWTICASIAFVSAWAFDKTTSTLAHIFVGGCACVAAVICVVNHFRLYCQHLREEQQELQNALSEKATSPNPT